MMELLDLREVSVRFGGLVALSDASLAVRAGEIHALIGPNGAGKSTLVNCITGYQRATRGSIVVRGTSINGLRPARIARLGVGRTFQTPQLFGRLSSLENVDVARTTGADVSDPDGLLAAVGLSQRAYVPAGDLAYGEQRLLEVARALARDPRLLLLDEPAAGLAATDIELLASVLHAFVRRGDRAVLIIEHNVPLVRSLADRVSVLHEGRIIASGSPPEVLCDAQVVSAYLGTGRSGVTP